MSYIGNTSTTQSFTPTVDFFSGNASTTAFTLSRPVASVAQVEAVIENVVQNPGSAYTISGSTITFTSAPPTGTNNIYVRYTSLITQVIQPNIGTIGAAQLDIASLNGTGAMTPPSGTTAQRPVSPVDGQIRYNSTLGIPEWYSAANASWSSLITNEVATPTNISPANAATGVMDNATLTASSFYTIYNGVTQSAAQWQVSTSSTFATTVINTGDDASNLTSYTMTSGILSVSTTYYWRVRYKNSLGVYSAWSTGTSFVTAASFRIAASLTISANTTNYLLNTAKVTGYNAGKMDVTLTINAGITVGSTSTGTYAFDVDTSWAAGDTVTIINNGTICGMGGTGGSGGAGPTAGSAGGPGLRVQRAVTINNASGVVAGGGGGGGAAAACGPGCNYGGGGGGAGANVGPAGSSGGGGGCNITCDAGTATTGGAGYAGNGSGGRVANGYDGGSRGAAGASGCTTAGGAGGAATQGNASITWTATGTRLGTLN